MPGGEAFRRGICALALAGLLLAGCGRPNAPAAPASSVKLFLTTSGLYRLTRADLQQAGLAVDSAALPRLQLAQHGIEIPIQVEQSGDDFSIVFYAAPEASPFSPADVFWLTLGAEPGLRMAERAVGPPGAEPPAPAFQAGLRLEEDQLYFPNAVGEAHWFWRSLTAPASETLTLTLPEVGQGAGQIRLGLAGLTEGAHRVQVRLNDQPVGEAAWQGASAYEFQAATAALHSGDNTLTLDLPGGEGLADVTLLDWVGLDYPRAYTAQDGALEFPGGAAFYRVNGFSGGVAALYDIANPADVQRLTGFQADANGLAFADPSLDRRYLAVTPEAARQPLEIRATRPPEIALRATDTQADYIIVAPREFFDALQPLVQHRTEGGLAVRLVDIENVYDAFSGGVLAPNALRDFLAYAHASWPAPAPRFVLLVGKATYDYRNNLGASNPNLVPTYLVSTPHLGQAASDNWFVAAGEDDLAPTMALGRIPAKTPAQVKAAVDKILKYEAGLASGAADWRTRAVFAADDKDPIFDLSSDLLAGALGPGLAAQKIFLSAHGGDVEATRREIVQAWNEGALLVTYIGHGSIDTWAAGPLFGSQFLDEIRNGDRLPILFTPTCLDGYFYHPEKDSLAEDLLFKTDGGIVAGLVPTGLSLPTAQDTLMQALFAELFARPAPTLGEAVLRARQAVSGDNSEAMREVLETFVLLGDPALKWRPGP